MEYVKKPLKNKIIGLCLIIIICFAASLTMTKLSEGYDSRAKAMIKKQEEEQQKEYDKIKGLQLSEENIRYLVNLVYKLDLESQENYDDYFVTGDVTSEEEKDYMTAYSSDMVLNLINGITLEAANEGYYGLIVRQDNSAIHSVFSSSSRFDDYEDLKKESKGYLAITFDENGKAAITERQQVFSNSLQEDKILTAFDGKTIQYYGEIYGQGVFDTFYDSSDEGYQKDFMQMKMPAIKNATVYFVYDPADMIHSADYYYDRQAYMNQGYLISFFTFVIGMMVLALILQNIPYFGLKEMRIFRLPTELIIIIAAIGLAVTLDDTMMTGRLGISLISKDYLIFFEEIGVSKNMLLVVSNIFIIAFWMIAAFCYYWVMASVIPYICHPMICLKENSICFKMILWLKKHFVRIYHWATDVYLDDKWKKQCIKACVFHGIILCILFVIFSFFKLLGLIGIVIYSIAFYVIAKKKLAEVDRDFTKVVNRMEKMSVNDFSEASDLDFGFFHLLGDKMENLQTNFRNAVEEEVRSRNMKTELITNVSHDLKTPLTAIITYIDLLKNENITEEERKEYLETLESKSARLKVLIEDLFEISKATSNNIVMNYADVNLTNFMKEVRLENEEKIKESRLEFRWNLPEDTCMTRLDPNRTYRIIDNLIQNILKYSLDNSRVYIDMHNREEEAVLTFRNISAEEMNFTPEEIVERFVRGDHARNSEGSGLGLAIAQSFTELQGGRFKIEVDGDLFKVTVVFKKVTEAV